MRSKQAVKELALWKSLFSRSGETLQPREIPLTTLVDVRPSTMISTLQIQELFINASISQQITENDWNLLSALSEARVTQEDRRLIKRIVHGVRRGWFSVLA